MENKGLKKIILRRETKDKERDKYEYYISCDNGIQVTTPFKEKATILNELDDVKVIDKDWKAIKP